MIANISMRRRAEVRPSKETNEGIQNNHPNLLIKEVVQFKFFIVQ